MIEKKLRPLVEVVFVIILALPLFMYAWIGFYSRYVDDDFWTAGYLRTMGFWDAQRWWYLSFSGRYSFTFLVSLAELPGVGVTRWLPMSSLVLWIGTLYWFWDGIFKLVRLPYSRWIRLSASMLVIYTTLRTSVGWQQALLWQTGLLTYTVPLIGLTFWFAWFLQRLNQPETYTPRWYTLLATALFFWFLGGLSETSLAFQITVLGLALVAFGVLSVEYPRLRTGLLLLAFGFAGSLAAFLFVFFSPGNSVRLVGGIHLPNMAELTYRTFYFAKSYIKNLFINSLRPTLCILGIPALFAIGFHPQPKQKPSPRNLIQLAGLLLLLLLVIFLVYWACFIPAYAAMRAGPPNRSMIIMFFWLSLTLSMESYIFGLALSRLAQWVSPFFRRANISRFVRIGAVLAMAVLLVLGPLQTAQKLWLIWPEYQQFATDWDIRDRIARQAAANGVSDVTLPRLEDLYALGPETSGQFALYYGLPGTITFKANGQ